MTKYLSVKKICQKEEDDMKMCGTDKSSSGEINTSLRLIIYREANMRINGEIIRGMVENSHSHVGCVSVASARDRSSC